jgi:hypothetical protein
MVTTQVNFPFLHALSKSSAKTKKGNISAPKSPISQIIPHLEEEAIKTRLKVKRPNGLTNPISQKEKSIRQTNYQAKCFQPSKTSLLLSSLSKTKSVLLA